MPDESNWPKVENKTAPPPGVMPRRAQVWILGGVGAAMILVLTLTGNPNPPKRPTPGEPPVPAPSDDARIREYRDRIEVQSRKLLQEQAQLTRASRWLPKRKLRPQQASRPLIRTILLDPGPAATPVHRSPLARNGAGSTPSERNAITNRSLPPISHSRTGHNSPVVPTPEIRLRGTKWPPPWLVSTCRRPIRLCYPPADAQSLRG